MLRAASTEDVSAIVILAHVMKRQLADWSPVYFCPRQGAEELHAAYLGFLVASDAHDTRVILDTNGEVVGFLHVEPQAAQRWVDDLYLCDSALWPQTTELLVGEVTAPWVTCVSRFDDGRSAALSSAGLHVASTYWARLVVGHRSERQFDGNAPREPVPEGPRHTFFGGGLLEPTAPGALVVSDEDIGYAIGSPGLQPPLYDPGGPACVVDRVHGRDRGRLLDAAMATAADRGDAGMVVVCETHDHELRDILVQADFRAEVDLYALL
jgi:hypothetical protein